MQRLLRTDTMGRRGSQFPPHPPLSLVTGWPFGSLSLSLPPFRPYIFYTVPLSFEMAFWRIPRSAGCFSLFLPSPALPAHQRLFSFVNLDLAERTFVDVWNEKKKKKKMSRFNFLRVRKKLPIFHRKYFSRYFYNRFSCFQGHKFNSNILQRLINLRNRWIVNKKNFITWILLLNIIQWFLRQIRDWLI